MRKKVLPFEGNVLVTPKFQNLSYTYRDSSVPLIYFLYSNNFSEFIAAPYISLSFHFSELEIWSRDRITCRDHPFKPSANFHDFWPLPPYLQHFSKMLMKGIFDPYVLWPFDHWHTVTPLPKTCWPLKWMVSLDLVFLRWIWHHNIMCANNWFFIFKKTFCEFITAP